jgi:NAD(P)-dependent dehydrogenase (short-subunit alcohol dehydrogenase family)
VNRTALVTGASRGIGKGVAVALARRGYDVAITARTRHEGDATSIAPESGVSLPGSLETTARDIEAQGVRCIPVVLDLLQRDALVPAVDEAIRGLGRIDVLVNNAIYVGGGGTSTLLATEPDDIVRRVWVNLTAQILLTQHVLRTMVAQRSGLIIGITSPAGQRRSPAPAGEGGWSLTYAAVKAGFHRIADMVATEHDSDGICAYNVNPGFVATERVRAAPDLRFVADRGLSPDLVGEAIAGFIDGDRSDVVNGDYVHAVELARSQGLLP